MKFHAAVQPVILLGMHRSGTAMIARLLSELGLFQGAELQEDHESTWFLAINDLLFKRVNAAWDNPAPIWEFLQNRDGFNLTLRCLDDDFSSKRTREFVGKRRSLSEFDKPWGWKDPRTIFTLPLWLRLFPGARLVYIVRNGVDVAKSLLVREEAELRRRIDEFEEKHARGTRSRLYRAGFKGSSRCLSLSGGFSLWEQYVSCAEQTLANIGNERLIVVYEKFLADPAGQLRELARFCRLEATPQAVADAIQRVGINPSRAGAFAGETQLAEFYRQQRTNPWLKHYGYA